MHVRDFGQAAEILRERAPTTTPLPQPQSRPLWVLALAGLLVALAFKGN